jgi:hypothetical protein
MPCEDTLVLLWDPNPKVGIPELEFGDSLLSAPIPPPDPLMPDPLIAQLDWLDFCDVGDPLELVPNGENPALALPGLPEKGERPFSSSTRFFKSSIPKPPGKGGLYVVEEDDEKGDEPTGLEGDPGDCFGWAPGDKLLLKGLPLELSLLLMLPPNDDADCFPWDCCPDPLKGELVCRFCPGLANGLDCCFDWLGLPKGDAPDLPWDWLPNEVDPCCPGAFWVPKGNACELVPPNGEVPCLLVEFWVPNGEEPTVDFEVELPNGEACW